MLSGRVEQHGRYKQAKPLKIIWSWAYLLREDCKDSFIVEEPNTQASSAEISGCSNLLNQKISYSLSLFSVGGLSIVSGKVCFHDANPTTIGQPQTQWFCLTSHQLKAVMWRPDRAWSCNASCGLNQMPGLLSKGNMEEGAFRLGWPEEGLERCQGS